MPKFIFEALVDIHENAPPGQPAANFYVSPSGRLLMSI